METEALPFSERVRGCLVAGACGDALGAPVEFMTMAQIEGRYGQGGISDFDEAYGVLGAITDDTQMTLFTAEGLIRAAVRGRQRGICHPPSVVHHAYLRWRATQDSRPDPAVDIVLDGWLVGDRRLWQQRAPGLTCLRALRENAVFGKPVRNDSKGCGTVMRDAPWGLVYSDPQRAFEDAASAARTTHGHPSAAFASGALAAIIVLLMRGETLSSAVDTVVREHLQHADAVEVRECLELAVDLSAAADWRDRLGEIGEGWVAEEALGIAVLCALGSADSEAAIVAAVNHSGDSDSTGAICGNLVGVMRGVQDLPARWLDRLEMRDVIERIAADLAASAAPDFEAEAYTADYPGW